MKKLPWLLILITCLFIENTIASTNLVDEKKVYQFSEGEYYRKLINQTKANEYIIQNYFLDNDLPFTNQYKIKLSSDLNKEIEKQVSIDGLYIQYQKEGNSRWVNYSNGIKEGSVFEKDKRGNILSSQTYVHGVLNGVYSSWWYNGNKKSEIEYKNGKEEGKGTIWYQNGNINMVFNMQNGIMDGQIVVWHSNGTKQAKGLYLNGKKNSIWQSWYANGNKSSLIKFNLDKIESCQQWDAQGVEKLLERSEQVCMDIYYKFYTTTLESEPTK